MPQPRVISSPYTLVFKVVFPLFMVEEAIRFAVGYVERTAQFRDMPIAVFAVWIAFATWWFWSCVGLKRVALTDDALHVSNFRREIVVPLRSVEDVQQRRLGLNAIVVHVAGDTDFGKRITFLPKGRYRFLSWTHPMVDRLRDAVAAAKRAGVVA